MSVLSWFVVVVVVVFVLLVFEIVRLTIQATKSHPLSTFANTNQLIKHEHDMRGQDHDIIACHLTAYLVYAKYCSCDNVVPTSKSHLGRICL